MAWKLPEADPEMNICTQVIYLAGEKRSETGKGYVIKQVTTTGNRAQSCHSNDTGYHPEGRELGYLYTSFY